MIQFYFLSFVTSNSAYFNGGKVLGLGVSVSTLDIGIISTSNWSQLTGVLPAADAGQIRVITKSGHLDQTLHRSEMGISLRTKSIAFTLCTRYLNKDSMEQDQPKKIECPFHLCNYLIAHASFLIQLLFWHNQFLSACNHSSIRGFSCTQMVLTATLMLAILPR